MELRVGTPCGGADQDSTIGPVLESGRGAMNKILEGDLGRLDVPDVLSFLNMGRRTGVLALEKPDQETKLFFRDGNPVYASSSKEELRLGAMLVRLRKVASDTLDRALSKPRSGRWRVGSVLLADKLLTEQELASLRSRSRRSSSTPSPGAKGCSRSGRRSRRPPPPSPWPWTCRTCSWRGADGWTSAAACPRCSPTWTWPWRR